MRISPALLVAALASVPGVAAAAQVTSVLDSFVDEADPFDFTLELSLNHQQHRATITKEYQEGNGPPGAGEPRPQVVDAKELQYTESKRTLDILARFGLYEDFEMSIGFPVVLSWDVTWGLADGTPRGSSVIDSNDFGAGVCPRPPSTEDDTSGWDHDAASNSCKPREDTQEAGALAQGVPARPFAPLFPVEGGTSRTFGGIGDPRFALTFGALDQLEDPSVPTWVLGFVYQAPLASVRDPLLASGVKGGAGTGFHALSFWTALSRRARYAEPYAKLGYTLSLASGKAFDGCAHPETLATPENCVAANDSTWTRSETAARPSHVGAVLFGSEFDFLSRSSRQRFYADVSGLVEYHSQGRDYSQATFMLQRLTFHEEYARVGARLGLGFAANEYVAFTLTGGYAVDTAHVLTGERIGEDLDGNGEIDLANEAANREINPNFDFRYDMPGRRLRATQISSYSFGIGTQISF